MDQPSRRALFWEGSSKPDFKKFPRPVQKDMGVALYVVQIGITPPSAKPLKGFGPSVVEIVEDHDGDTYRAVYTTRIKGNVYVLHAFQKKSTRGVKTPRRHLALVAQRLKAVLARQNR